VSAQSTTSPSKKEEEKKFLEFEALASEEFRNVNLVAPIFKGLNLEGHYFGVRVEPESEEKRIHVADFATIAGSYSFRIGEHLELTPGFGVYFGEGQKTSPALTFRWDFEKGRILSQGLFIKSFRENEEIGRPSIWDGNHVSIRFWRLEVGPSWERIHTRTENEWKGGGRAAVRIVSNFSLVFFVVAPKTEFRAGILIHLERKE